MSNTHLYFDRDGNTVSREVSLQDWNIKQTGTVADFLAFKAKIDAEIETKMREAGWNGKKYPKGPVKHTGSVADFLAFKAKEDAKIEEAMRAAGWDGEKYA